ncbi:MAG: hypothetical protein K6A82_06040 [Prevotella sp.]|nr:hypothetical protein [Prevotella sp.]
MKIKSIFPLAAASALLMASCADSYEGAPVKGSDAQASAQVAPVAVAKTNQMQVYAHFMPWFETSTSNKLNEGKWGYHWTMANCDPDKTDASGKREIASHYYPLTGPYASGDEAVLDYQCLLMKYAGLDGVMVDWYGVNSDNTVARHKSNTEALFRALKRAGLKMSIVYEDNALSGASDKVTAARQDMRYLAETFFKDDSYVKVNGRPLLLDFGPQQMVTGKDWYRTFSILSQQPMFLVLNGHINLANEGSYGKNAQGEYTWVNPSPDYADAKKFECYVGGAMPGFHDYYRQGGAGDGYTTYDSENGALFQRQLDAAKTAGLSYLQVSTWNDYGEGTTIEPTLEYGYKYLVMLQQFTGVSYQQADLELIYRWYQARTAHPGSEKVAEAYNALVQLKTAEAKAILDNI